MTLETSPKASVGRYGETAILLHWAMAALIVVVSILGLLHDSWPRETKAFWINMHAMIGLVVAVLLLVRIQRRLASPAPPLPESAGALSKRLSGPVHLALYALLIALPVIGVVTFVWHGRAFDFGLFRLDFGVKSNRAVFHPTEEWHGYLAYALFGLVALHALAALWHQFVRRDELLMRMWPSPRG